MRMFGSEFFQDVVRVHGLTSLPEPGSAQRAKFMFTDVPPVSSTGTMDGCGVSATTADEPEINKILDVISPHLAEVESTASPQAPTPSPSTTSPSPPRNTIGGPAALSRETSESPRSSKSITNSPSLVSSKIPQFPLSACSPILVHSPVLDSREVAMLDQAAVVLGPTLDVSSQISQAIVPRQLVIFPTTTQIPHLASTPLVPGPSQTTTRQVSSIAPDLTAASDSQISQAARTNDAGSSPVKGPAEAANSTYKTRVPSGAISQSRRNSIEGVPDVILTLGGTGYELSGQPNISVAPPAATSSTSESPTTLITPPDDLIVPSSQQSLEEVLTIPPGTDAVINKGSGISRFAPRVIPEYDHDQSDFPSWLHKPKRLKAVQDVEAGDLWKKLIGLWLQQERRLAFGLNNKIVSRTLFLLHRSHPSL